MSSKAKKSEEEDTQQVKLAKVSFYLVFIFIKM